MGGRCRQLLGRACIVLGACLLLAACGSAERAAGEQLSKAEYIEQSNSLQADAGRVLDSMHGSVATTPAQARRYLTALDALIAGMEELEPPEMWADEHERIIESTRTMRQSMMVVSRASARNTRLITAQLERSAQAQRELNDAVRDINASR